MSLTTVPLTRLSFDTPPPNPPTPFPRMRRSITFPDFVAGQQLVLVLDNSKLSKEAKRQRIEKLNPRNARDIAKVNKLN